MFNKILHTIRLSAHQNTRFKQIYTILQKFTPSRIVRLSLFAGLLATFLFYVVLYRDLDKIPQTIFKQKKFYYVVYNTTVNSLYNIAAILPKHSRINLTHSIFLYTVYYPDTQQIVIIGGTIVPQG